ncbi:hypothetical protein OG21DRAFT_1527168 [Imleria badia]|nr:hypothetical protein OG21DRAFT_1527168 [Imleria badia]
MALIGICVSQLYDLRHSYMASDTMTPNCTTTLLNVVFTAAVVRTLLMNTSVLATTLSTSLVDSVKTGCNARSGKWSGVDFGEPHEKYEVSSNMKESAQIRVFTCESCKAPAGKHRQGGFTEQDGLPWDAAMGCRRCGTKQRGTRAISKAGCRHSCPPENAKEGRTEPEAC